MDLQQFWDELNKHDWYHSYSDDNRVWRAGADNYKRLHEISKQSPEHKALLKGFNAHYFSGKPWGTEQSPKPERPDGSE